MGLSADVGAQRFKTDTRGGITCAANDLGYNPGHHGEAQSKEEGPQVIQSQDTQTRQHWRQVAQRCRHADRDSRKEDGCLGYDLYRAADAPGAFLLHEVWASREAHAVHMHTSHFLRWNARKDALLASRDATFWKQIA